MSEATEIYAALKTCSQANRAHNRNESPKILKRHGVEFESKNRDAHLIVHGHSVTVDFWPGTGKWIVRGGTSGRGVFNLLKLKGLKP